MNCGAEWCAGEVMPASYEPSTAVIQHRNGSGRTTLPAAGEGSLIHGRFGLFGLPYVHGVEVNFSVKELSGSASRERRNRKAEGGHVLLSYP